MDLQIDQVEEEDIAFFLQRESGGLLVFDSDVKLSRRSSGIEGMVSMMRGGSGHWAKGLNLNLLM